MNRSFSKIRHIQEANLRLEKRMLSEQVNPVATSGATSGTTQNKTYGSLSDYLANVPNIKSRLEQTVITLVTAWTHLLISIHKKENLKYEEIIGKKERGKKREKRV